jgi:hypothetical protein
MMKWQRTFSKDNVAIKTSMWMQLYKRFWESVVDLRGVNVRIGGEGEKFSDEDFFFAPDEGSTVGPKFDLNYSFEQFYSEVNFLQNTLQLKSQYWSLICNFNFKFELVLEATEV